ncbi:MAG: hypothetical protein CMI53_03860 [Parcubacteria group bacterium]|nr:hypothetical protein [Parcubacteria group bacterium]
MDYQTHTLKNSEIGFRGPKIASLKKSEYFVCVGAAQTFGCFCEKPYPTLLQEKLQKPVLNFGVGGAGPSFFLLHDELLKYINNAKFVIVQVMSGRSENNALFNTLAGAGGILTKNSDGSMTTADDAYHHLLESEFRKWHLPFRKTIGLLGQKKAKKIVAESRSNWVNNYKKLLTEIKVPKILFWFSKRKPDYKEKYTDVNKLFGEFPQLVNKQMVEQIKQFSDKYVECISYQGSPQLLSSRFTGKPITIDNSKIHKIFTSKFTHNSYYPSPEMNEDAAKLLEPICQKFL